MKILIIQENGRHEKNREFRECFGWQKAFISLGHRCDVWGLGHVNYDVIPEFHTYDVIINLENYDATGWVPDLSRADSRKFLYSVDAHCVGMHPFLKEYKRGGYEKILQATLQLVDENSVWFPNAYDDTLIKPLSVEEKYDIGFCGNINNRGLLLDELRNNFKLKEDIFVIGDDMVKAINSYKIHFNCNIGIDINYRNFETIGCGTALLTNFNPAYKELGFINKENCIYYDSVPSLLEGVSFLLENPEERDKIAHNGFTLSKKHTYLERAKHFLEEIL